MKKSLIFIIPVVINLIILFSEQFQKMTFFILFNFLIILMFLVYRDIIKGKIKSNFGNNNKENFYEQESAQDHPIIVSARKRLKK